MLCIRGQQDIPSLLINMLTVRMDIGTKKIMSELSEQLCPLWKVTHAVFENLSSVISTNNQFHLTKFLFCSCTDNLDKKKPFCGLQTADFKAGKGTRKSRSRSDR